MVDQNCAAGVIEIAAEAIAARCLEGVAFQAAVVTDIGVPYGLPTEIAIQDRRAKAKLFRKIAPGGAAVVNADDPHAEILGAVNLDARRVSFGMAHPTQVDVSARIERLDSAGSRFVLHGFDRSAKVDLRLYGPRQVSHAVAAAALAWALEIDLDAVVAGLEGVANVAGHLEAVDEGQDFDVRIDAAQTAARLYQALTAIRAVAAGQVHCVLSAEGNQDQGRPADPGRGRRAWSRSGHPHAGQPALRVPRPDPRRPAWRLPPSGQGPRRARPQACHRGRPGRRPSGRLGPDRRQRPRRLPDLRGSRHPV